MTVVGPSLSIVHGVAEETQVVVDTSSSQADVAAAHVIVEVETTT